MEPWLDSLSEDWNSQPGSSPGTSLRKDARRPPDPPTLPAAQLQRSRIPRYNGNAAASSPALPRPRNHPVRKNVLRERRSSDINIRPRSSSSAIQKPDRPPEPMRSSSTSSVHSVVRHDTVERKAKQQPSPDKQETPEWKRLAFRKQEAQQDLFAPIGLESIFAQPDSADADLAEGPTGLSFSEDVSSMPSSPPPWPFGRKQSKGSPDRQTARTKLSIVQENDEALPGDIRGIDDSPGHEVDAEQNLEQLETSQIAERESHPSLAQPKGSEPYDDNAVEDSIEDSAQRRIAPPSSQQGSSVVSGGFSPVFISKHNAVNGQVSYAPVDLSDPGVQERLKLLQSQSSRQPSQAFEVKQRPETPDNFPTDSMRRLPKLSGFVSVERGGFSDEGSFRRRPLSPSCTSSNLPSESVVPSDSVSQVQQGQAERQVIQGQDLADLEEEGSSVPQTRLEARGSQQNDDEGMSLLRTRLEHQGGQQNEEEREVETPPPRIPTQSRSPEKPTSASPLKLFGDHDTFTNNQLLRRMSQMRNMPSSSSPASQVHADTSSQRLKTQTQTSETTASDPESAETAVHLGRNVRGEQTMDSVAASRDDSQTTRPTSASKTMETVIGQKRIDALYRMDMDPYDADEIARRRTLRPRNPTPSRRGHVQATSPSLDRGGDDSYLDQSVGDGEQGKQVATERKAEAAKIRALASEAASFRSGGPNVLGASTPRKPSVSTQDYLDEAMKIMDLIRSRKKSVTALTGVEEASVYVEQDLASRRVFTPQTISRPPSREGGRATAWRTGNEQTLTDAKVMDHLRKYEETGDESFIVSSILRSVKANQEAAEDEEDEEQEHDEHIQDLDAEQMPNIRIRESRLPEQSASPPKTSASSQGTGSTGQTVHTTSSQRAARNLGTIEPDKVSHLLQKETGRMRFDTEKQSWVRVRQLRKSMQEMPSSSAGSEDALGGIPDLSVDEELESLRVNSTGSGSAAATLQGQALDYLSTFREESGPALPKAVDGTQEAPYEQDEEAAPVSAAEVLVNAQKAEAPSPRPVSKTPTGTVKSKRRGPSVLFSSPPVSKHYEAQQYASSSEDNTDARFWRQNSSPDVAEYQRPSADNQSRWQEADDVEAEFDSELSLVEGDEHRQVSLFEQHSGHRTMSLTLSFTTPLPTGRGMSRPGMAHSAGLTGRGFLHSLSPMSEFTVHQDDSKHLKPRQLQPGQLVGISNGTIRSSRAVSQLVEKLTDAEPDEPYWDFMRSLDLSGKSLDNVHALDEFCPSIEELHVGGNCLNQLAGAPLNIRTLNVRDNQLSSLTSWGHLRNLQYLDVSGNGIDSLEAFNGLVHLRELKVDCNQIRTLKGIEDLDGLLSLSLSHNELSEVDFCGMELRRLVRLDLSFNKLTDVRGLNALPCLEQLNLSNNRLSVLDGEVLVTQRSSNVEELDVSHNLLTGLGVDFFPRLRTLNADSNCLVEVDGARLHPCLRTVSLRNQRFDNPEAAFEQSLDDFCDVEHLSLSGTRLPLTVRMSCVCHSLRTLDLSFTGLQSLPADFAELAPGLRVLNLNANAIKDLRPLRGLSRLRVLHAAGNRASRMRRMMKMVSGMQELRELDVRGNAVCAGFYGPAGDASSGGEEEEEEEEGETGLRLGHVLPRAQEALDEAHVARLDDETRLKRRVFELLLGSRCPSLGRVNGLGFAKERVMAKDAVWGQLVAIGIVEKA